MQARINLNPHRSGASFSPMLIIADTNPLASSMVNLSGYTDSNNFCATPFSQSSFALQELVKVFREELGERKDARRGEGSLECAGEHISKVLVECVSIGERKPPNESGAHTGSQVCMQHGSWNTCTTTYKTRVRRAHGRGPEKHGLATPRPRNTPSTIPCRFIN